MNAVGHTKFSREVVRKVKVRLLTYGPEYTRIAKEVGIGRGAAVSLGKRVFHDLDPDDDWVAIERALAPRRGAWESLTHFERQTVSDRLLEEYSRLEPDEWGHRSQSIEKAWGVRDLDYLLRKQRRKAAA
jgi:hypothetical protein